MTRTPRPRVLVPVQAERACADAVGDPGRSRLLRTYGQAAASATLRGV
jgi:hypothetical protein